MISRAVRLLVSASLLVVTMSSCISTFAHFRFSIKELPAIMLLLVMSFVIWNNVKLDWILLRSYKFVFVPPRMSWLHLAAFALLPLAVYCAQNLTILYDGHLSIYDFSVRIPIWLSNTEEWQSVLQIVFEDLGVRMVLFYILVLSVIAAMYYSGWFTANIRNAIFHYRFSWQTVWSRIALAVVALPLIFLNIKETFRSIFVLFDESKIDPNLLNLPNTSLLFFKLLNALILIAYALWILCDGLSIHSVWKHERGVMKTG